MWNDFDKKAKEPTLVHEARIKFLKWSENGDRLVIGDEVIHDSDLASNHHSSERNSYCLVF